MDKKAKKLVADCKEKGETRLELNDLGLSAVPREIGTLINLIDFSAAKNQLTALPPEFQQLPALRSITLRSNLFSTFPNVVLPLIGLQFLDISQNQIEEIPDGVSRLVQLRTLDLSSNKLKRVNPSVAALSSLVSLSFRDNQLKELPLEMGRLTSLRRLDIGLNPLDEEIVAAYKTGFHPVLSLLRRKAKSMMHLAKDDDQQMEETLTVMEPVSTRDFEIIQSKLREEMFPDFKLQVLEKESVGHYFTAEQARQLVLDESYPTAKVALATALLPRVLDPSKFYRVLDALPFLSDRMQVAATAPGKRGKNLLRQEVVFDPRSPAGYYRLNLSDKTQRAIAEKCRDLEMEAEGENMKMIRLDGRPFQLFHQTKEFERLPMRAEDGFLIRVNPEICEHYSDLTVQWKVPLEREQNYADWIGLFRPGDPDDKPPLSGSGGALTWDEVDNVCPTYRVAVNGRTEGIAKLLPAVQLGDSRSGWGVYEARYIEEILPENHEGSVTLRCLAQSATIFVCRQDEEIKTKFPKSGILEFVYLGYGDDENPAGEVGKPLQDSGEEDGEDAGESAGGEKEKKSVAFVGRGVQPMAEDRYQSLLQRLDEEPFLDTKLSIVQNMLSANYVNVEMAHAILHSLVDSFSEDNATPPQDIFVQVGVALYARCTEREKFPLVLQAVSERETRKRICEIIEIDPDSDPTVPVATDKEVMGLVGRLTSEKNLGKRIACVRSSFSEKTLRLTTGHLRSLLGIFTTSDTKIEVAVSLYGSLHDRHNFKKILDGLSPEDREAILSAVC